MNNQPINQSADPPPLDCVLFCIYMRNAGKMVYREEGRGWGGGGSAELGCHARTGAFVQRTEVFGTDRTNFRSVRFSLIKTFERTLGFKERVSRQK